MRNKTKKVCAFDFDGTLVDSMGDFADVASRLMSETYGLSREEARKAYLVTSGIPFEEQLEGLFPGDLRNVPTVREFETQKKRGYFEKGFSEEVPETLEALRGRGIRLVVSSNNYQGVVDEFLKLHHTIPFDLILGWRPNFAKGRDHFLHIQSLWGVTTEELLFVGDSLKDGERCEESGVDFVGKIGIFSEDDFRKKFPGCALIRQFSDLKGVL